MTRFSNSYGRNRAGLSWRDCVGTMACEGGPNGGFYPFAINDLLMGALLPQR